MITPYTIAKMYSNTWHVYYEGNLIEAFHGDIDQFMNEWIYDTDWVARRGLANYWTVHVE